MDPLRDLPMGFGMALFQDQAAAAYFAGLPEPERRAILNQTHAIHSKQEMRAFVHDLPKRADG